MTDALALALLKSAAIGLLMSAAGIAVFLVFASPASATHRYFGRYVAYLEQKLRLVFLTTRGEHIAFAQLGACAAVIALALLLRRSALLLSIAPCALGPALYLELYRRRRVRAIEARVDTFTLALANALKATPSIGNALAYVQPLLPAPLDVEVMFVLKEMRLGRTLDEALLGMAARVRSVQLDAALSGVLVGRQVGGDLPKILERTASTLREMARLSGVVRAKTAEGKAQLVVLAVFPFAIVLLFDSLSHGYFDPLAHSVGGWLIVAAAILLWLASLLTARKVLEVDL